MKRTVFITGAARGIGASIAERYSKAGYEIISPKRQELDLSDTKAVQAYLAKHPIQADVLICNAGENRVFPITELKFEDFERIVDVNLSSTFLLAQNAARFMSERRWGRIVMVSSVYSYLARPGRAAYMTSKSGMNGLMRALAVEFGPQGVLCNAICPGFVETDLTRQNNSPAQIEALAAQTALKRLAQPAEIAEATFFLGSEQNTYLTGQMISVDGGFSVQ